MCLHVNIQFDIVSLLKIEDSRFISYLLTTVSKPLNQFTHGRPYVIT